MSDQRSRFVEAYESQYRSVFVYCRRRLPADRVDDAVAETFLTAWRKIDDMPSGDRVLPWLYGVAYRVILHVWRGSYRRRRLGNRLASLGVDVPAPPEEFIVASYESSVVLEATRRLKNTDQEILRLHLWEELPHPEIALALDLKEDAVRQRYARALKNLTREFNRLEATTSRSPAAQEGGT